MGHPVSTQIYSPILVWKRHVVISIFSNKNNADAHWKEVIEFLPLKGQQIGVVGMLCLIGTAWDARHHKPGVGTAKKFLQISEHFHPRSKAEPTPQAICPLVKLVMFRYYILFNYSTYVHVVQVVRNGHRRMPGKWKNFRNATHSWANHPMLFEIHRKTERRAKEWSIWCNCSWDQRNTACRCLHTFFTTITGMPHSESNASTNATPQYSKDVSLRWR